MIIAGPCLLNDDIGEINNCIKTAKQLYAIDPAIMFRCKLWGGGTTPEKYKEGIGDAGIAVMNLIKKETGMKIGTEIRDSGLLRKCDDYALQFDFFWVAARACQNYDLLDTYLAPEVYIKRGPGMTIDEMIGLHDICKKFYGYKPVMIERGINTFCRALEKRWTADFDGMIRVLHERPDIELMFDPSHAGGRKEYVFPMVKAACAIGVKNFMLEVYADPAQTQTDQAQAISVEEFKPIYDYIKNQETTNDRN